METFETEQPSTPTKPVVNSVPPRSCASPQTTKGALPVPTDSVLPPTVNGKIRQFFLFFRRRVNLFKMCLNAKTKLKILVV